MASSSQVENLQKQIESLEERLMDEIRRTTFLSEECRHYKRKIDELNKLCRIERKFDTEEYVVSYRFSVEMARYAAVNKGVLAKLIGEQIEQEVINGKRK